MVVVVKTSPNLSQTDPGVEVSPCISSLNIPGKFAPVSNTCFTSPSVQFTFLWQELPSLELARLIF